MSSLYMAMGGHNKIRQLTETFLQKAMADDLLGKLFAGKFDHAAHIGSYFDANFGGPTDYFRERGDLRFLLAKHVGMSIGEEQRRRWVQLMLTSAREVGIPEYAVAMFGKYLEGTSRTTMAFSNVSPAAALAQLGFTKAPKPLVDEH